MNASSKTITLLKRLVKSFPKKKAHYEALMLEAGFAEETITQTLSPATAIDRLPTFGAKVARAVSPMLKARFEFAGSWQEGTDIWLAPSDMAKQMRSKSVLKTHRAIREHWEDSAPMQYGDHQLTLFRVTPGVPENLTYLVWSDDEPEVWAYVGMNERRFKNLNAFLRACLEG